MSPGFQALHYLFKVQETLLIAEQRHIASIYFMVHDRKTKQQKQSQCVSLLQLNFKVTLIHQVLFWENKKPASDDWGGSHSKDKHGVYFCPKPVVKWAALF